MKKTHMAAAAMAGSALMTGVGHAEHHALSEYELIDRADLFGNPSASQGRISPDGEWVSWIAPDGSLISGDPPTKEMPLHSAFYDSRAGTGAVVHLHSTHSVALSMLPPIRR